jgi:hypothetical protein
MFFFQTQAVLFHTVPRALGFTAPFCTPSGRISKPTSMASIRNQVYGSMALRVDDGPGDPRTKVRIQRSSRRMVVRPLDAPTVSLFWALNRLSNARMHGPLDGGKLDRQGGGRGCTYACMHDKELRVDRGITSVDASTGSITCCFRWKHQLR